MTRPTTTHRPAIARVRFAWAVAAMLVAAAGVMWWPQWQRGAPQGQDAQLAMPTSAVSAGSAVASAGSADGAASSASVPAPAGSAREAALAQPGLAAQPSASLSAQGTGSSLVTLRAVAVTWVEVAESSGQVLLSRHLQPGESASTQGRPPLTVRIGNAQGTQLEFRGQQVDLRPATRDNVTRIELN